MAAVSPWGLCTRFVSRGTECAPRLALRLLAAGIRARLRSSPVVSAQPQSVRAPARPGRPAPGPRDPLRDLEGRRSVAGDGRRVAPWDLPVSLANSSDFPHPLAVFLDCYQPLSLPLPDLTPMELAMILSVIMEPTTEGYFNAYPDYGICAWSQPARGSRTSDIVSGPSSSGMRAIGRARARARCYRKPISGLESRVQIGSFE
jgi:hypothetical protein